MKRCGGPTRGYSRSERLNVTSGVLAYRLGLWTSIVAIGFIYAGLAWSVAPSIPDRRRKFFIFATLSCVVVWLPLAAKLTRGLPQVSLGPDELPERLRDANEAGQFFLTLEVAAKLQLPALDDLKAQIPQRLPPALRNDGAVDWQQWPTRVKPDLRNEADSKPTPSANHNLR